MIEICLVIGLLSLVGLLASVDFGRWLRRLKDRPAPSAEAALVAALQEKATLLGETLSVQTRGRQILFHPDGTIEEKNGPTP